MYKSRSTCMHTNDKRFCRESSPFKRCGTALWADFGGNHLRRSTHKHIITYRFYHKEAMKIKDLPPVTVRELCRYLNIEGDGQRNWKELVSRIPGRVYTVYDISEFARAGQRSHTSPAEEVIMDLITLGVTVESLYRILHTMDARQCMNSLANYVSPEVIDEVEALRLSDIERAAYQPEPVTVLDPGDPLQDGDVHPVYGPLPNPPPPMSSQEQELIKRTCHTTHPSQALPYTAQTQQCNKWLHGSEPFAHAAIVSQGNPVPTISSTNNHSGALYSSQKGAGPGSFVSSTSSSYGGAEIDSRHPQPSPPYFQNGSGTSTDDPKYSNQYLPTITAAYTSGKTPSKGCHPHNYPSLSGPSNQQVLKGTISSYHQEATGSTKQHSHSPSWLSSYSSATSQEQLSSSHAPFHSTLSSNGGVQRPIMSQQPRGQIITPSYIESSRYSYSSSSSGYTPGDSSSSTFTSLPIRKEERSKYEERSVEPNILKFTYAELSEATDGFVKDMIGLGSFGTVFRAKIRGNGPYAVKKLYSEREMGGGVFYEPLYRETFTQELHMLTRYHHRNILSLVAYSNDGPTPCLVYEYMENGSLADCFQGKRKVRLLWNLRLKIANQIADALHFLHTVNKPKSVLVHGDVKSANILLDGQFVPKLSDFGLARECSTNSSQSTTINTKSDIIMGTMAYLAPEFIRNKKFKPSADVYSFGVVLLELYTGQLALSDDPTHQDRVLTTRLATLIDEGSESHHGEVLTRADPKAFWPQQTGLEIFDIATVCLRHKPKLRPPMEQVLDQLHLITPQQSPQAVP